MIGQCHLCDLDSCSIAGDGNLASHYVVLGEAPGATEVKTGLPFTGAAGRQLAELLELAGLNFSDIYLDNIVACRPKGNKLSNKAIRACAGRLESVLVDINPEVVILLGRVPVSVFGNGLSLKANHGLVFEREVCGRQRKVVVMYHPAACLHNPGLRATLVDDWRRLPERLEQGSQPVFVPTSQQRCSTLVTTDLVAVDTETAWLGALDAPLVGISVATADGVYWLPPDSELDVKGFVVLHNAKYDYQVLRRHAVKLPVSQMADTMIAAYLCGEGSLGLKGLAKRYLNVEMATLDTLLAKAEAVKLQTHLQRVNDMVLSKSMAKSLAAVMSSDDAAKALKRRPKLRVCIGEPPVADVSDVNMLFPQELMEYACADAECTLALWPLFEQKMKQLKVEHLFWDIEMPLVPVLADIERRGLQVDRQTARQLCQEWQAEMTTLACQLHEACGLINPGSADQIRDVVFGKLGFEPVGWTETGKPSTAAWILEQLAEDSQEVSQILRWRQLSKLVNTYLKPWLATKGRIHPEFNQVRQRGDDAEGATATGRLSSSGPNFQNVPKRTEDGRKVRSCIVAEPDNSLVSFDFVQLEWVLMGVGANDSMILEAYADKSVDIHQHNADILGVDRETAKRVTYLWTYMGRAGKLAQILKCSRAQAQQYLDKFEAGYPYLREWRDAVIEEAAEKGYATTLWGRRRYIPELAAAKNEYEWYEAAKRAFNMFPQGTAADIAKLACVRVAGYLASQKLDGETTGLVAQVHDECLVELPTKQLTSQLLQGILKAMRSAGDGLPVQLRIGVQVGTRWGEMSKEDI